MKYWNPEFNLPFHSKAVYQAGNLIRTEFLVRFPISDGRNTTRKDLLYSSQSQKFQRRAKLNKWNTGIGLRHRFFFRIHVKVTRSLYGPSLFHPWQPGWKMAISQQFRQISYSFVLKILCLAEISAMRGLHTANHFLEMEERNPKSKQKLAQPVISG